MMKKLILSFALLVIGFGVGWATTAEFTLTGGTGTEISTFTSGNVTLTFAKGEGSNAPKLYSESVRFYAKNTLTIGGSNITITNVAFTFTQSSYTLTASSVDDGAYTNNQNNASGTWSGSSSSFTITNTGTSQARIKKVIVTYTEQTTSGYSITGTGNVTGGNITSSATSSINAGDDVTITATPTLGYELTSLIVDGNNVTNSVSDNQYSFQMPSHNVAVSATFSIADGAFVFENQDGLTRLGLTLPNTDDRGYLNDNQVLTSGIVNLINGNSGGQYNNNIYNTTQYGIELCLYANSSLTFTVPDGYQITKISFKGTNTNRLTDVTNDEWSGTAAQSVTLTASGSVYIFIINVEYEQATIEPTYSITGLSNITNGSVTASETSNITAGTNITLTISPDTGYELETLTVDGDDVTSSVSNNEYSFSMPSHDVAVSATFTASGVGGSGTMTFVTTSQSGGVISGTLTGNPEGVTVSCTGNVNSYQSGRGIQLTQSKNTLTFTASGFTSDYKLTGININYCSNASSGSGVANATLGQTSVASELSLNSTGGSTLRNAPMTVTETIFNGDDLIITITASANSIYINEIDVDYVENVGPSLTIVEGIAAFKQVDPGTTVRLYLPDTNNARVTHVENNSGGTVDAYVRDNTGAIRFTGISPNRPMAYNQHLAGWINGQYSVGSDGIPQFVPDEGLTNTAFLVIADPVTEPDTEAKAITTSEIGNNLGDWVTITEVDVADVTVNNVFNLNYPTNSEHLYAGATIDINAIAALGQLYPVDDKDQYPITFVVNSAQNYTAPNTNITNVKVRLKRNLAAEKWTGLIVPFGFELTDFDGKVMELSSVTKGDDVWGEISERWFEAVNMNFVEADEIVAGKPYLIKPDENVSELTFTGVTLSSQDVVTETLHLTGPLSAPAYIGSRALNYSDDYTFTGSYSPTTITDGDRTVKVFNSDGEVEWVDSDNYTIDGTNAYFVTPADQGLHINFDDVNEPIITGVRTIAYDKKPTHQGIYNIMGVKMQIPWDELPPGIYIVNGHKTVKQ